MLNIFIPT